MRNRAQQKGDITMSRNESDVYTIDVMSGADSSQSYELPNRVNTLAKVKQWLKENAGMEFTARTKIQKSVPNTEGVMVHTRLTDPETPINAGDMLSFVEKAKTGGVIWLWCN